LQGFAISQLKSFILNENCNRFLSSRFIPELLAIVFYDDPDSWNPIWQVPSQELQF
jgi:hypothetical protein